MTKRISIIFIFLTLVFQCGCGPDYVVLRGHYEPFGILENDMPYADKLNTKQFDQVQKIETDSYGRDYYIYRTYSIMWAQEIEIHVISQKSDRKNVYYYEDLCYMMENPDGEPLYSEDVEAFKERNDWGKPLNADKMSTASKDTGQMEIVDLEALESAVINYLDFPTGTVAISNGIKVYEDGSQIFIVQIDEDGDGFSDPECCYITLYTVDDGGKILYLEEFPQTAECNEYILDFKLRIKDLAKDLE